MPIVNRLRRPCQRCNKKFKPSSRFGRICDNCIIKTKRKQ